ncbi:MAG: type III pantothenate kinase [Lachnospiraceae bacterium]|jgi:type III pantothenate kinase|nr:type III pantothenate kinase [Lachnospiraceae bacterium]MCI1726532.1 type III pantothenate kinase [Lachnospiraceae bacterium]
MILTIDMGNTQTEIGGFEDGKMVFSERVATDHDKTDLEYAVLIHNIFEICGMDPKTVTGGIISSVVPPLTDVLIRAVEKATGVRPIAVGPGVKNGLKIRIDDPKQLGADLVVGAVGGIRKYGAPLVLIDLGTASTISAVGPDGDFLGGVIIPGVRTSLEALVSDTSQLQKISLQAPGRVIGTNTIDSMNSGIIYGQAALFDGMIDRFLEEMKTDATVVATGGLAGLIIPYCRHRILLDRELMLTGLLDIYEKNVKTGKR